jgi:dipeptidyl aminopeptidase/acylaminoacyl peptidase
VRVPDEVALGHAKVAMRFEGWPEGRIAPSTHRIPVAARKPLPAVKVSPAQRSAWSFDGYSIDELRYTPDGRTLVVLLVKRLKDDYLYLFRLWDVAAGKERAKLLQIEPEPLKIIYTPDLAIAADGKSLVVRYNLLRFTRVGKDYQHRENGVVHLIDLGSGRQRWSHEGDALGISGAAFSPEGRTLVTGHTRSTKTGEGRNLRRSYTGEVRFWDVSTGRQVSCLSRPDRLVGDTQFSPNGKYVLISEEHRDSTGRTGEVQVHVWDVAAKKALLRVAGSSRAVFSPDGTRLATYTDRGHVKVREHPGGKELAALPLKLDRGWIRALVWSGDGKSLFAGTSQGELWRWEVAGSKPPVRVRSLTAQAKQPSRNARPQHWHLSAGLYAFGVNGELPERITGRSLDDDYAELPPPEIVLWDLKAMRRRGTFTGHRGQVNCLAFSPDGKTLVSGGTDGTVRFWDVAGSPR